MTQTAVILAAGRGSRLDPGGGARHFAKPLMQVRGHTLLCRTIASCRAAGAARIVVVTGFRAAAVETEAHALSRGDVEVVFNPDWRRKNGLSVHACRDVIGGSFALMMADHVFDPSILADLFAAEPAPGSATLAVDRDIERVFDLDDATKVVTEGGAIRDIGKELAAYDAVDCGLFLCTQAVFPALEAAMGERGDCSLSDGMKVLAGRGSFRPFDIGDRWWQDVDTPEMLAHATGILERLDTAAAGHGGRHDGGCPCPGSDARPMEVVERVG